MTYDFLSEGLCPEIVISDQSGVPQFRWEHPLTFADPVQDFALESWDIRTGLSSDVGSASIVIDDPHNTLTNKESASRRLKIRGGWHLEIWLRRPGRPRHKWFSGIIEYPGRGRPGYARQKVLVTAIGWGVRLSHRYASINFYQKKQADGINLDNNDTAARASEIVKRIVTDTDILVSPGQPLGITVQGVDALDIKLPDFVRRFQTLKLMISELAQAVGCVFGVDPEGDLFFHLRGGRSSGFLISNDHKSDMLETWADRDKVAIASNSGYTAHESDVGVGYSTLIGLGAIHEEITSSRAPATTGTPLDLPDGTDTAFSFRLGRTQLSKVAVRLSRTATCTSTLLVSLVGSDTGSAIDPDDIRGVAAIPPDRLNNELASDGTPSYIEVSFGREPLRVFPYADMHIIIAGTADPVRLHRSGSGTAQRRNSDSDAAWAAISGGAPHYRAYAAETMHIIAQDTSRRSTQGHKETTIPLHDYPSEHSAIVAMEGMLGLVGSTRMVYDPIMISAPGTRPQPGSTLRLVDGFSGVDTHVEIIGHRIGSTDAQKQIAETMEIEVEEWVPTT